MKTSSHQTTSSYNGKASDLGFGHMGNGIVVWDRTRQKSSDYVTVAHIQSNRNIKFFDLPLSEAQVKSIQSIATFTDPDISATQNEKVFTIRP